MTRKKHLFAFVPTMNFDRRNQAKLEQDLKQLTFAPENLEVTVLEYSHYEFATEPLFAMKRIKGEEIKHWLRQDFPVQNGVSLLTGLKLILSPRRTIPKSNRILTSLPFTKDTFTSILCEDFGLHHSFVRTVIREKSSCSQVAFCNKKTRSPMNGFQLRSDATAVPGEDVLLSIATDEKTRISKGIIHGCTDDDMNLLIDWISLLGSEVFHPLLFPAIVLDFLRTKHCKRIDAQLSTLIEVSAATHQYDPKCEDFAHVNDYNLRTKEVVRLHQDTGDLAILFAQTRKQVEKLLQIMEKGECASPPNVAEECGTRIKEQLEDMLGIYDVLEQNCAHIREDCSMLMNAIFNLIAQRQNQINVDIADDSREIAAAAKRDSSSMKAIALVTMIFLPGTFVASFFAMPLLNWPAGLTQEQQNHVVNPRFKYYWAVTVPLTLVVILFWAIWNRLITATETIYSKED